MTLSEDAVIDIVHAELVKDYQLKLRFSDGVERVVDFGPFLHNSRNPLIRAYLDLERFAAFRIEQGDLIWDDYGLCFPVADLYEDRV
ncbi:MAG: DUF2442 domain-containing protein [Anaerolineae bacterium]